MNATRKSSPPRVDPAREEEIEPTGLRRIAPLVDRKTFFQRLEAEMAQTWCTSIVVLALDDFERIDGAGGHAAGDAVVHAVTRVARTLLRAQDMLAQVGRAELAIVLGGVALGEGRAYTDRLRASLSTLEVPFGGQDFRVTLSAGVACSMEGIRDARALYQRADNRLLAAKERGQSLVRVA